MRFQVRDDGTGDEAEPEPELPAVLN